MSGVKFEVPDEFVNKVSPMELFARVYGDSHDDLAAPGAREAVLMKAAAMGVHRPGISNMEGCIAADESDAKYGRYWRLIRVQGGL